MKCVVWEGGGDCEQCKASGVSWELKALTCPLGGGDPTAKRVALFCNRKCAQSWVDKYNNEHDLGMFIDGYMLTI